VIIESRRAPTGYLRRRTSYYSFFKCEVVILETCSKLDGTNS